MASKRTYGTYVNEAPSQIFNNESNVDSWYVSTANIPSEMFQDQIRNHIDAVSLETTDPLSSVSSLPLSSGYDYGQSEAANMRDTLACPEEYNLLAGNLNHTEIERTLVSMGGRFPANTNRPRGGIQCPLFQPDLPGLPLLGDIGIREMSAYPGEHKIVDLSSPSRLYELQQGLSRSSILHKHPRVDGDMTSSRFPAGTSMSKLEYGV